MIRTLGAAILFVLLVGTTQSAQALVMFTTDGTAGIRTDAGFTIGNQFTVGNQNIVVTGLGIWDGTPAGDGTDGLNHTHEVGVWNSANALLTSVTVPSGTAGTLIGEVRYASVGTPIILAKNQTYWMGGLFATGTSEPFRNNSSTPTLSPHFSASTATYNNTSGAVLLRPATIASPGIYFGPNLEYTVPVAQLSTTPADGSTIDLSYSSTENPTIFDDVITLKNTGQFGSAIDITGYSLSGPNGAQFDIVSFAPITLTAGVFDEIIYDLSLDPALGAENYAALLTIMTSAGNITFNLEATFVPEPSSLSLALFGIVGLHRLRRRVNVS